MHIHTHNMHAYTYICIHTHTYILYTQYTYIYTHIYPLSIIIHTSYIIKIELVATVSISLRAVGDQRKLINFSLEPFHQLVL